MNNSEKESYDIEGVLVIDKPIGPTSHDVVQMVKEVFAGVKAGHLGTLDPLASGVLPIVFGKMTKMASRLAGEEKIYEFTCSLGQKRTTDDLAGKVIYEKVVPKDFKDRLKEFLPEFTGVVIQKPPLYSAIRSHGRRLYQAAVQNESVEIIPRLVRIDSLDILSCTGNSVKMLVKCQSGTYVRSICRDIGERLGCGGYASEIRRLKSGRFGIEDAIPIDYLEKGRDFVKSFVIDATLL